MTARVTIDPARREMSIGEIALPIGINATDGSIHVLPPLGPVLRPVTFGERYRMVELAFASVDPAGSLQRGLADLAMAVSSRQELDDMQQTACEALALHLAGAGVDAPSYADTMLLLAGSAGWRFHEIEDAEASRIDRLALRLQPQDAGDDDGWSRVVFAAPVPLDLDSMVRELAASLLDRFDDPSIVPVAGHSSDREPAASAVEPEHDAGVAGDPVSSQRSAPWSANPSPVRPGGEMGSENSDDDGDMNTAGEPAARRSRLLGYSLEWTNDRARNAGAASARLANEGVSSDAVPAPDRGVVRLLRSTPRARSRGEELDGRAGAVANQGTETGADEPQAVTGSAGAHAGASPSPSLNQSNSASALRAIPGRSDRSAGRARESRGHSRTNDETILPLRPAPSPAMMQAEQAGAATGPMPSHGASHGAAPGAGSAWPVSPTTDAHLGTTAWSNTAGRLVRDDIELTTLDAIGMIPGVPATAQGGLAAAAGQGIEASLMEIADALADMLNDEADLRGLDS